MPCVNPIRAHNELIRGKVQTSKLQRDRNDPVGIFSITGTYSLIEYANGIPHESFYGVGDIPPIDYATISQDDLKKILLDRFASIRDKLIDPDIEIECIRGVPPT
jgi:hypothetical protein